MNKPFVKSIIRALAVLLVLATMPASLLAAKPLDFEAEFEVYRNGKMLGESRFTLAQAAGQWTLSSETHGTKGLARIIGFHEQSTSTGDWKKGLPRPLSFDQNIKVAIKKIRLAADFDWQAGFVDSVHEDGTSRLQLEPGVIDPSTVGLLIRAGLMQGKDQWQLRVLDEDEIEDQRYELASQGQLNTALGCMQASSVEKIRAEGSKRYTRTWYAKDLDFIPVRVEHGKKDGDHMETRIKSLKLGGQPIEAMAACES